MFDNIEANAGTDFTVMQQVYSNAFRQFAEQGVFGSSVSAAHIGVGYTQQEILAGLQDVQAPVPTPLEGTYTDAASQKVLVNLRQ